MNKYKDLILLIIGLAGAVCLGIMIFSIYISTTQKESIAVDAIDLREMERLLSDTFHITNIETAHDTLQIECKHAINPKDSDFANLGYIFRTASLYTSRPNWDQIHHILISFNGEVAWITSREHCNLLGTLQRLFPVETWSKERQAAWMSELSSGIVRVK